MLALELEGNSPSEGRRANANRDLILFYFPENEGRRANANRDLILFYFPENEVYAHEQLCRYHHGDCRHRVESRHVASLLRSIVSSRKVNIKKVNGSEQKKKRKKKFQ